MPPGGHVTVQVGDAKLQVQPIAVSCACVGLVLYAKLIVVPAETVGPAGLVIAATLVKCENAAATALLDASGSGVVTLTMFTELVPVGG